MPADRRARVELATFDAHRAAEAAADVERRLDDGVGREAQREWFAIGDFPSAKEFKRRHWPPFISSRTWLLGRRQQSAIGGLTTVGPPGKLCPSLNARSRSAASHNPAQTVPQPGSEWFEAQKKKG
jgi:hypothetical protein